MLGGLDLAAAGDADQRAEADKDPGYLGQGDEETRVLGEVEHDSSLYSGGQMKQMYHPDDLAAMDPLVLMRNLDHVRMTSRRLSYILQQQVHLYTPEANRIRGEIDEYVEAERQIEWEMARRGLRNE